MQRIEGRAIGFCREGLGWRGANIIRLCRKIMFNKNKNIEVNYILSKKWVMRFAYWKHGQAT